MQPQATFRFGQKIDYVLEGILFILGVALIFEAPVFAGQWIAISNIQSANFIAGTGNAITMIDAIGTYNYYQSAGNDPYLPASTPTATGTAVIRLPLSPSSQDPTSLSGNMELFATNCYKNILIALNDNQKKIIYYANNGFANGPSLIPTGGAAIARGMFQVTTPSGALFGGDLSYLECRVCNAAVCDAQ